MQGVRRMEGIYLRGLIGKSMDWLERLLTDFDMHLYTDTPELAWVDIQDALFILEVAKRAPDLPKYFGLEGKDAFINFLIKEIETDFNEHTPEEWKKSQKSL
ncbi:MAG: hypothetical protein AABX84_01210 [Nanoarchaeota archaeon]